MKIPANMVIHRAICTEILHADGESQTYKVTILFDGVPEVFHIELDGQESSFEVAEENFERYGMYCYPLKGLIPLMRRWHRGERRELPVDLADVHWT